MTDRLESVIFFLLQTARICDTGSVLGNGYQKKNGGLDTGEIKE